MIAVEALLSSDIGLGDEADHVCPVIAECDVPILILPRVIEHPEGCQRYLVGFNGGKNLHEGGAFLFLVRLDGRPELAYEKRLACP